MGDLRLIDIIICGGIVVTVVLFLGAICWSADQAVEYGYGQGISHTGRSRRRVCQRDRIG